MSRTSFTTAIVFLLMVQTYEPKALKVLATHDTNITPKTIIVFALSGLPRKILGMGFDLIVGIWVVFLCVDRIDGAIVAGFGSGWLALARLRSD